MDNILIVVNDLEVAKTFFAELGMELEGKMTVEGPLVDPLIGLQNVRATLALMRTPAGHGRIELDKFHMPEAIRTGGEVVQYEDTYQASIQATHVRSYVSVGIERLLMTLSFNRTYGR